MSLDYLGALKRGDSREIKVLYKETFPLVRKFVLQNRGTATDAEDIFQKALLQKKKVTYEDALEHESTDMALAVLEQQRWELFTEALDRISENCRHILKLYFNKRSYEEIIKIMKYTSEVVARQRVFKCKAMLKTIILKDKRYHQLKEL